jgi:alternate signal-mediated exported protein
MAGVCTPDEFCEADMDQSIKGALAAASAGVVLVGSLGSFAYWNATGTFDGDTIESGKLALIDMGDMEWLLNGYPVEVATVTLVPGDNLSLNGTFEIDAEGNNLAATFGVEGGGFTGTLAPYLSTGLSVALDYGSEITNDTTITEDNDGSLVSVAVSMVFPYGIGLPNADNGSQGLEVVLSDVEITLTQTDATP